MRPVWAQDPGVPRPSWPQSWARLGAALTFCSRKPRSSERAHSRKERAQVRMTTTSNRSRKLLSPVGRWPRVRPAQGQGQARGLQGFEGLGSGLMGYSESRVPSVLSGAQGPLGRSGPLLSAVWGLAIPRQARAPGRHWSGAQRLTMSEDAGVLALLDVGLGLQADGDPPTVRLIVKGDLQGWGGTGGGRVNHGPPDGWSVQLQPPHHPDSALAKGPQTPELRSPVRHPPPQVAAGSPPQPGPVGSPAR